MRCEHAQDDRILEPDLDVEFIAVVTRDRAGDGVGNRHREHVNQRQYEGPGGGDRLALAGDDAGQYRDHRKHAGRKGQADAGEEKQSDDDQQAFIL